VKKPTLYRVDGGRRWGISTGHLMRSLTVAKECLKGHKIIFIMKNYPEGVSYMREAGFTVWTIDDDDDTDETLIKLLKKYRPSQVILDLYTNPYKQFFHFAKAEKIKTVVFDSFGDLQAPPDVVINESLIAETLDYNITGLRSEFYTGPDYFLLPSDAPAPLSLNLDVGNIAITMGGSDPAGITERIVECLIAGDTSKRYKIILGPLFSKSAENKIRENTKNQSNFTVIKNPPSLLKELQDQDIVICAAGRTLYECAYLGRPTIVIPTIDHEEKAAAKYSKHTGCVVMRQWNSLSAEELRESLLKYEQYHIRKHISSEARVLVDGLASKRIQNIVQTGEAL
jgi:UDP-2,4-diacetamido-2,4,6-trideoxy-beta-L-altropyranose hydrolase